MRRGALVTENGLETLGKRAARRSQFFSGAAQCLPRKPLFHVILLKGQSKAPAPLDQHLTLLLVSGRPPVPKHVTHRQDMPADKQPWVGSSASPVCDEVQKSPWQGWRMTKSCCMSCIVSSCSRFSHFREICAPWQRNVITLSYNGFPYVFISPRNVLIVFCVWLEEVRFQKTWI